MAPDWNGSSVAGQLSGFLGSLAGRGEPGLAVGVYRDGALFASAAAGSAVVEHDVPITEHTAFDIASVSKQMTAACVLLLARDGRLHLDDDIRAQLPELALTRPVTLRQCLTHTAGLRDYFALCDLAGIPVAGIGEPRFMQLITGQGDLDFAPGSAFSYSNTGYVIAAATVRRVTGHGLARFAQDHLFGPLGMSATHFRDNVSVLVPRLACGYVAAPDGFRRCDVTEEVVGDGAVITTIVDLAAWHAFMSSGAVLGTDIRDGLLTGQTLTDGTPIDYALGVVAVDVAGTAAWWHSGAWAGYRSAVIYLPAERAGISVLANRDDHNASLVALTVARALGTGADPRSCFEEAGGKPAPADAALRQRAAVTGLWHEGDEDLFLEIHEAEPGQIAVREQGEEYRFQLGTDGAWHGLRTVAGRRYNLQDGTLIAGRGLSKWVQSRYRRLSAAPAGLAAGPAGALPGVAGTYYNAELAAYGDVAFDAAGAIAITIGLAEPRPLEPAGPDVWRGDGLTVRVDSDSSLLVSVPGARRVRFAWVAEPPANRGVIRGLRTWFKPL
jgi:CubicO group peptidase (beta-lactamase class C family)